MHDFVEPQRLGFIRSHNVKESFSQKIGEKKLSLPNTIIMADWFRTSLAPNKFNNLHIVEEDQDDNDNYYNNYDKKNNKDNEQPPPEPPLQPPLLFTSRRSAVVCQSACVATSQTLASAIGYDILKHEGGNAADAAIAIAAALAVTEPCSTGLGGDMFCLWYDNATKKVSCINGSGKSPQALTWERVQQAHPLRSYQAPSTTTTTTNHNNNNRNADNDDRNNNNNTVRSSSAAETAIPAVPAIDATKFRDSALSVTVPGAAQGWEDLYHRHGSGKLTFAELLEPAAKLAEKGFPVAPITSFHWCSGMSQITQWLSSSSSSSNEENNKSNNKQGDGNNNNNNKIPLTTTQGLPPQPGDMMYNSDMARVLRDLGEHGAQHGFYQGATGKAIVDVVQQHGGCLTMDDLVQHDTSEFPQPISAKYRNCRLWQVPPNGQGIASLIALEGVVAHWEEQQQKKKQQEKKESEKSQQLPESSEQQQEQQQQQPHYDQQRMSKKAKMDMADMYHLQMEMMRLGFADIQKHVADMNHMTVTTDWLLDQQRIGQRVDELFDPNKAVIQGIPDVTSCTVSFQVVDTNGNAISFVNSNFMGFGTGLVPTNCGFTLQNRGYGFELYNPSHPNFIGKNKRPFHTIIPAILTHANETNDFYATLSNMGGNMQPQGHLQLTMNLMTRNMNPQEAIDFPRFCIVDGTKDGKVYLEDGVDDEVVKELQRRGHDLVPYIRGHDRCIFGRAQIIARDPQSGVLWGGSDGRADGCAMGY